VNKRTAKISRSRVGLVILIVSMLHGYSRQRRTTTPCASTISSFSATAGLLVLLYMTMRLIYSMYLKSAPSEAQPRMWYRTMVTLFNAMSSV